MGMDELERLKREARRRDELEDELEDDLDTARAEVERLRRELRVTARERDTARAERDTARVERKMLRHRLARAEGPAGDGGIENEIIGLLAERVRAGRRVYGLWQADDPRSYNREALEEIIDALAYCAAELLRSSAGDDKEGGS